VVDDVRAGREPERRALEGRQHFRYSKPSMTACRAFLSPSSLKVWAALLPVLLLGCEHQPAPGQPCKPEGVRCLDPKTELACQNGFFIAAPCKGPDGCRETEKRLLCDIRGNAAGDVCSTGDEGNSRCSVDGRQRIVCRGGKYVVEPCRGRRGCHATGGTHRCDQSLAVDGDACTGSASACAADGKRVLTCKAGRFEEAARCEGKGGCTVLDGQLTCDQKTGE
jgi:hypothetical protein